MKNTLSSSDNPRFENNKNIVPGKHILAKETQAQHRNSKEEWSKEVGETVRR